MPDGLLFSGYLQPPTVPPDPTGDDWRGLTGATGPTGPPGPSGIFSGSISGGTIAGSTISNSPISGSTGSFTSLAASGNATVAGTLGVTGAFTGTSGSFTSGATVGSASFSGVAHTINAVSGGAQWVRWQTAGSNRWQIGPSGAQTGSNVGADFLIGAFDDSGTNLNRGLTLTRASGGLSMTTNNVLTAGNTSANAASTGLFSRHTFSGTSGVNGVLDLNNLRVTDTVDHSISSQITNGWTFEHDYGGGTTKGSRNAFNVNLLQTAANTDAGADNFYGAGTFYCFVRYSQPGATAAVPLGSVIGFNTNTQAQTGFTPQNLKSVVSYEADVGLAAGATAWQRTGVQITNLNDGQAYGVDCALYIYNASITTGLGAFKYGILFGDTQQWPIDTHGTIIGANMGNNCHGVPYLVSKWGVDLDQVTLPSTGNAYDGGLLRGPNVSIDGNGRVQIGSAYITPGTAGLAIDAKGSFTTSAVISAAGSGYRQATHYFTTAYGGVFAVIVDGTGSGVGTVTQISPAQYASTTPPSNPIAAIDLGHLPQDVATPGTGLAFNLTWNTTATTLALQPAGGPVTLGGVLKLQAYTVATLPSAATAGAGAMAYVTDATSPTYRGALTGSGSVVVPVFSDGSAWTAH